MHVESTLGRISTDAQAPAAADSLAERLHTRNGSFEVGIAPCGPAHPWRAALVELDRRSASADLNELPGDPAVRHATLVCAPLPGRSLKNAQLGQQKTGLRREIG